MNNLNFAVYVDAENISHNLYEVALSHILERGNVSIKHVYADWSMPCYKHWKTMLHNTSSIAKQQFHYGNNDVDNAIVMDAIELSLTNKDINAIAIMSSDGGYFSLAQRLREQGKYVVALGNKNTPIRFKSSCNEFITINSNTLQKSGLKNKSLDELLLDAYQKSTTHSGEVLLSSLGSELKKIDPIFSSKLHGYKTINQLLKAHHLFVTQPHEKHGLIVKLVQQTSVLKLVSSP
jgi:uncharacterized LabA/DUF88 family protein